MAGSLPRPSRRRSVVIGVVLLLIGLLAYLCFFALPAAWQLPVRGTPHYVTPPVPAGYSNEAVDESAQQQIFDKDVKLVNGIVADLRGHPATAPFVAGKGEQQVLVVPPRDRHYTLPELADDFPQVITQQPDGVFLLKHSLVTIDSTLQIGAPEVSRVLLRSDANGYAFIAPVRGSLVIEGTPQQPIGFASFNPETQQPDTVEADGRAYLRALGSRMTLKDAVLTELGYLTGAASGVAWMRYYGIRPTGGAQDTIFARNHFGAYSSAADALVFDRTEFRDNRVYGFDPHTDSNNLIVKDSIATGNGKHGIIFSEGCHDALIVDSQSSDNGGAGFFIDDGNPDRGAIIGSNRNVLQNLTATNNGVAVIIEGGTANVINGLTAVNNAYGVWIKEAAEQTAVSGISVTATLNTGVRLDPGTTRTAIAQATVDGVPVGLDIDNSTNNTVTNAMFVATNNGLQLPGDQTGNTFHNVSLIGASWNPVVGTTGQPVDIPAGVDASAWREPPGTSVLATLIARVLQPLGLFIWLCLLLPPLLLWIPARRRRRAKQNHLISQWWDGSDTPSTS